MKDLKDKNWSDKVIVVALRRWLDSGYFLKEKSTQFSDKWDEEYEIQKDFQISPRFCFGGKNDGVNLYDTLVWLVDSYLHF